MTAAIVMERLEKYIRDNFLYARPDFELTADRPLMGTGVIDSMGIMELITFIDEEFGVSVEDEDITEQNLKNLGAITAFISNKLGLAEPVSEPEVAYANA